MTLRFKILALGFLAMLGACSTTQTAFTPFQAAIPGKFGFSEQRIETARYRVMFEGNSRTTRQRVEDSLLLRAANVTLENGYDWFQIVNRATDPKTYQIHSPAIATSWGGGYGHYGGFSTMRSWSPRHGWIYHHQPFFPRSFYNDFGSAGDVQEFTRFHASAEIVLGKGAKPADRVDTFDARDVTANLSPLLMGAAAVRP